MRLKESRYGFFYSCSKFPECKGTHGAHPNGKPLGKPADKETRYWRAKAHDAFDPLWKDGGMTRNEAYYWLRVQLKISKDDCHIGRFDIKTCKKVIDLSKEFYQWRYMDEQFDNI
jgi:ssDNA-binding Zn-finger/Zn-ribbon topoisomerase 1